MTRLHRAAALALAAILAIVTIPRAARAEGDYDVESTAWNGLHGLSAIAQDAGVELRTSGVLDWDAVRRGDGLLVLYPLATVDRGDLTSFLEDGGRFALFDDFGEAGPLLEWFRVGRQEHVRGPARSADLPGLLVATRRAEHALTENVDALVTNEPVALWHPSLSPVFAFSGNAREGLVLAGEVNRRGRLVIAGDPSVLINSMLRFPGNRQFARNLLVYLAGGSHGRVHLVHSRFDARGVYRGRSSSRDPVRELERTLAEALDQLSTFRGQDPTAVQLLASVIALLAALALAMKSWGSRPSDRFGPMGLAGPAASVRERIALFSAPQANMLYPSLVAKRYLERALLRAVDLAPPTDVGAVIARAGARLSPAQQAELRALLLDLDGLVGPGDAPGARVSVRRFLSLWGRIDAILTALGGTR